MPALTRREFGKIVAAGVPLVALASSTRLAAARPVVFGVTTSSFRDLPRVFGRDNVDDVIRAVKAVRATTIELALFNVEPAPPSTGPVMGGTPAYPRRIVLSPEEIAATNADARAALRAWRLETPAGVFDDVRRKVAAAGIAVHACSVALDASFSDEEIEATFNQVKALGVTTVSSPMTMATAARVAPIASRHRMSVAIHNQVDGNAAAAIATGQLGQALAISSVFSLKLDVGNLAASNCDAVATLREHQARVSHVLVRDRLRNGGASQPFGEGDTPIAPVIELLASSSFSIPAFAEYDYVGLRPAADELTASLAYLARASK